MEFLKKGLHPGLAWEYLGLEQRESPRNVQDMEYGRYLLHQKLITSGKKNK